MTYAANETATQSRPVELFTFARGAQVWRYAASDADVTLAGLTYRAAVIERDALRVSDEGGKTTLTVRLAASTPLVTDWRAATDDVPATLTLARTHRDATGAVSSAAGDRVTLFLGVVAGLTLDDGVATLRIESLRSTLERPLLRHRFARQCPHTLYDYRCGVDADAVALAATVTAVGTSELGATVTVTVADGATALASVLGTDATYLDGGYLLLGTATAPERYGVVQADVSGAPTVVLTLLRPVPAAAVGDTGSVLPGCPLLKAICQSRFNNVRRFGGFAELPERNPLVEGVR